VIRLDQHFQLFSFLICFIFRAWTKRALRQEIIRASYDVITGIKGCRISQGRFWGEQRWFSICMMMIMNENRALVFLSLFYIALRRVFLIIFVRTWKRTWIIFVVPLENISKHHVDIVDLCFPKTRLYGIPNEIVHLPFVDLLIQAHDRHIQGVF